MSPPGLMSLPCSYVYAYTDTPHTHIHAYTYIIHAHRDAQTVCRIGCRQLRQVIPPHTHTHTHLQITHQSTLPLAALVSLTNSMYPFAAPLPLSYASSILSEHPTTISPTPPMFVQSVQELVCRGHAQRERWLRRCSLYAMSVTTLLPVIHSCTVEPKRSQPSALHTHTSPKVTPFVLSLTQSKVTLEVHNKQTHMNTHHAHTDTHYTYIRAHAYMHTQTPT